jgi:hypothetical protein
MRILFVLLIILVVLVYSILSKKEKFTQNKCAFCIPLHPKHFNYGYEIIDALNGTDADLYFIFTDDADKDAFYKDIEGDVNYLILSDFVDIKRLNKNRSWVSVKKMYALSKLYKRYEYISCIDSEVMFINKTFYKSMKHTSNDKMICGGDISDSANRDYIKIIKESLTNIVPVKDRAKLKQISQDYSIYTWWSNLPVYDSSKARGFLDWVQFNNTDFIDKMTWYVFDDIVYNYYVILKYNYKLVVIPDINTSLEYASNKIIQQVDKEICKLHWVNYSQYKLDEDYYKKNDFIIAYHLDR